MSDIYKSLLVLLLLLICLVVGIGLTDQAIANGDPEPKTLDRDLEPVIVRGANVASLSGTPVNQLFLYTYSGATLAGQIPMQVDEVTPGGDYVAAEDGLLDANDEIVFMALDLGDEAPATASLTTTLPISAAWYEIEVTDPLNPTKKGWAYLVRSNSLGPSFGGNYANYSAGPPRISASQYDVGFATTHIGLQELRLNGGVDILDRTKLRITASSSLLPPLTEDDLGNPSTTLIKDGPVRVVLKQVVQQSFAGGLAQGSVSTIYHAYAALLQGTATISFTLSGVTLSSVRSSLDLQSVVVTSPPTVLHNANTPGGVIVDGTMDVIAAIPISNWTQISHTSGRLIQVTNPAPAGGVPKNYYSDNSAAETNDPGESGSYGDSGFSFTGNINKMFTIPSAFFILPAGSGNTGDLYEDYFFNPLRVWASFQGVSTATFLPIIIK